MSDTDMEEPPTKVSKVETSNVTEEGVEDEMEEGQEEWLSEGLLTDDDYNPNAEQDQSDSNLANTTLEETPVSMPSANTSVEETQQEKKIESIEKTLTSMDNRSQLSDDLDTFLIRKTDGKVVAKKEDLTDDGNDTDDLLRLLGEDDEKTKKKVLVKTAKDKGNKEKVASDQSGKKSLRSRQNSASTDDDDFVFEGAIMTKLKVAKNALIRNFPASKAMPEDLTDDDDDETDASLDEAKTLKNIFNVHKKPNKLTSKSDTKQRKPLPKSTPMNTRAKTSKAKLEHVPSPSQRQQRNSMTAKPSPTSTVKSSPRTVVKPSLKPDVKTSSKTIVKPSPKSVVKPSPKSVVKPSPKSNVKSSSKTSIKSSPRPTVKSSPKTIVKSSTKPIIKPSPKSNAKSSPKPVVKPSPKSNVKPSPKPAAKPSPKPILKLAQQPPLGNKPALKTVTKPSAKRAPRPVSKDREPSLSEHEEIINEEEFQEEDDFDLDEITPELEEISMKTLLNPDFADAMESEFDISRDRQLIMRPEQMDEEMLTDPESDSDSAGDSFDELPSSDSEDQDSWFTLDIRAERAGDYIPMLGMKAYEMLIEEKHRVSDQLMSLRARFAELNESGKRQEDLLRNASLTLTELDDMLKAT